MSNDQPINQHEHLKIQMHLQEQSWIKEREMMALDLSRRTSLLKHYIEIIDLSIKHIKEVEGLEQDVK
mgnify:CR=1 FL=1